MSTSAIGLSALSGYVPRYRLGRDAIAAAWGGRASPGARAVANFDEDPVTLGAAALDAALGGRPGTGLDGLILCTTTAPFAEKSSATTVAAACDLRRTVFTLDAGGSLRAPLSALRVARDAVAAGSARAVAVAASDVRVAEPASADESSFGDAAVATIVSAGDVFAELLGFGSVSRDLYSRWRIGSSPFVVAEDARYAQLRGFGPDLTQAVQAALEGAGVKASQVRRAIFAGLDPKSASSIGKKLGLGSVEPDAVGEAVGQTGSAHPLLALSVALGASEPGDLVVCAAGGDGAEAIVLRATDRIVEARAALQLDRPLAGARPLPSYARYLRLRGIVPGEGRAGPEVTQVMHAEEERQDVRLYGSRCRACSQVQYPIARVCIRCHARDQMDEHRLARDGTLFTFTRDHLFVNVETPTVMAVVQLTDGGRLYCQMTDADADKVQIEMPVEIVLRRLHEGSGHPNYFWKCRPKVTG